MQADVIHVMDEGAIVESGKPPGSDRARRRFYAQSWKAQMRAAPGSGDPVD
jgi:ABC-type multidrug transport system fused ATPase/permease subunit